MPQASPAAVKGAPHGGHSNGNGAVQYSAEQMEFMRRSGKLSVSSAFFL